jgi:RimJ/RimL family protein N-acetyltransferase
MAQELKSPISAESAIPRLRKPASVIGKTLIFRNARTEDAEFILSLRTDQEKSRFLSATSGDVAAQRAWLDGYASRDDQVYFIIEYQNEPIGTVRLYDPQGASFCWGSWILKDSRPRQAALESALMVYAYAVDHMGFSASHFDVRKGNERVWQFHERLDAKRVSETELDYLYVMDLAAIQDARRRLAEYLPDGVSVTA